MILSQVLRGRGRMVRNLLVTRRTPRGGGANPQALLAVLLIAVLGGALCLSFGAMFVAFDSLGLGTERAGVALSMVLAAAVAGLLVFDLHYAVSNLLFDSDLPFLMRSPLTPGQILMLKLLDSLPRTMVMILVLALPAVLAFSLSHRLPLWGWLLVPLQLLALWAIPLGFGLSGALLLVWWVPARRARDVLALLSTLVILVLWVANAFVLPRAFEAEGNEASRWSQILEPPPAMMWISPPHWVGSAVTGAVEGDLPRALVWTLALAVGSALSFALAARVTRALLGEALARVAVDSAVVRGTRAAGRRPRFLTGWSALVFKDVRLFTRDWTVLGDVIVGTLLWTLLPLAFRSFQAFTAEVMVRAMLVALTIGLGFEVGARAVPFERGALAWSRMAPLSTWRWNLAKLASGLVISAPLLALATLVCGIASPIAATSVIESFVAGISSLVLALSAGLWVGWSFGDPRWTNPRAMLTLGGRILSSVVLLALAAMWLLLFAVADSARDRLPPGMFLWGPPLMAAVLAAPALWLAVGRASRFEWRG